MTPWALGLVVGAIADGVRPTPDDDHHGDGVDGDRALVARVRGGDRAAFELLYRRHVTRVFARVSRLVGPVPERDDLVQEVFLGLYRALPGFRGEAALSTLLHRITANVAFDHLRRRRRRPSDSLDAGALEALISADVGPEVRTQRARELARVLAALDRIKPRKRIALLLRVVEGLPFEEIGAIVAASADTAKKRAQHGLRELTALLGVAEEDAS